MLARIRIVLVRPRRSGNVGAVARAMKNMGLADLVLVAPRARIGAQALRMAAHASDVLAAHRTTRDLAAALADCTLAIGTVGRPPGPRARLSTPRELIPEMVGEAAAGRRIALVFGPEDHGLSNADLEHCQRRLCIPTADEYASLNLAQAVLVCAYELQLAATPRLEAGRSSRVRHERRGERARAASLDQKGQRASDRHDEMSPATGAEREALLAHLDAALRQIGFLAGPGQKHILRDVRSLFDRSGLTRRDVRIWRGIARQTLWATDPKRAAPASSCEDVPQDVGARRSTRVRGASRTSARG